MKIFNDYGNFFKLFFFLFIIFLFSIGCNSEDKIETTDKSIPVSIFKVKESPFSSTVNTSGKIIPYKEMRLSFKTGGKIDQIYVNEGNFVRKGDILAELDLKEINAKLVQAKSAFEKAERDFSRVEKLYQDSVVTLEQFQNTKTAYDVAKANLEIASFNRSLSTITAPTNGQIYNKFAEVNEIVGPGTPIFHFGSSGGNWEIEVGLTDKDIKRIKIDDTANVQIDALRNEEFTAIVSEIAGNIDPFSSTYKVKLNFKDPSEKIISGMIASVTIYPEAEGMFKTIPIKSLVNADNLSGEVFTIIKIDSTVIRTPVVIKAILNEMVLIEKGLENNDFVVLDGVEYMFEGAKIRVVNNDNKSGEI